MENSAKGQFNEQIRERTTKMAVAIHEILINVKASPITRPIILCKLFTYKGFIVRSTKRLLP